MFLLGPYIYIRRALTGPLVLCFLFFILITRAAFCFWLYYFIALVISSPKPRLIGELIGYSWSSVRPSSLKISNIFFSKTACPIKAKFYVEPHSVGGTKVCSRHLGHMTKMAATPIYSKNPSKSSSPEPAGRFSQNLVCIIGDSSPS